MMKVKLHRVLVAPPGGEARAPDQVAEPKVGPPLPKPEVERENKQSI